MKTIAFFNNKGGVGKTSCVYHIAWMYADLGLRVVAADLDPQSNLTSMFLPDDALERLWWPNDENGGHCQTVYGALQPLLDGEGDIANPHLEEPHDALWLLPGDLRLSKAENELSSQWPLCLDRNARAFRVISAFWRILERAATLASAHLVLIDVGPNLGALNRAALVAADHVVTPLAPDLYSLQGLRNLGPTLDDWRAEWQERREKGAGIEAVKALSMPEGSMQPAGYIIMQHAVRLDRPVKAYGKWMARIPGAYSQHLGNPSEPATSSTQEQDPNCLAALKHFRSLMPLAQEARKPMFELKPSDGAIGGHMQAVAECRRDFVALARGIAQRCGFEHELRAASA